jgi:hypothetical protein
MNLKLKKINKYFNKNIFAKKLCIFLFFFFIFILLQFSFSDLAGVDGYYHIKQAYLIRTKGISVIRNFSWLEYSVFKNHSSDLWLGYHLILIPFTYFKNLILGMKIATTLFSTFFLFTFYLILTKIKIKYPIFWTMLLLVTSEGFLVRLLYPRGAIFSIFFLILGNYFILKRRYWFLFFLSWLYGLFYPGFFVFIIFILIFILLEILYRKKIDLQLLIFTLSGVCFGLVLRPDFPNNLYALFVQDLLPFYYKFKGISLAFGSEFLNYYNPFSRGGILLLIYYFIFSLLIFYKLSSDYARKKKLFLIFFYLFMLVIGGIITVISVIPLIADRLSPPLFILFLVFWLLFPFIGLLLYFDKRIIRQNLFKLYLFIITSLFLIGSLVAGRFIEYFAPLTILSLAYVSNFILSDGKKHKEDKLLIKKRIVSAIIISFILIVISRGIIYGKFKQIGENYIDSYKYAAEYLEEQTSENELIFHLSWSDFPGLFYYNHENHYISAMDPTFMYVEHPELYWLWDHSSLGIWCNKEECLNKRKCSGDNAENIYRIVKGIFNCRYIFVESSKEFIYLLRHRTDLFKEVPRKDYFSNVSIFEVL